MLRKRIRFNDETEKYKLFPSFTINTKICIFHTQNQIPQNYPDIERGDKIAVPVSRSESSCTHNSVESSLKETRIDTVEPMPIHDQNARIVAYHQLALTQSSVESDATNQDVSAVLSMGVTFRYLHVNFVCLSALKNII